MSTTNFAYYGLDKSKNFLQAPICECGCGEYMNIILKDDSDICSLMYELLTENDCNHCAIFVVKNDGTVILGAKLDDDIQAYNCKIDGSKKDCFKEIQETWEWHCYGLLEQADEESYRIIMD